MEQNPRKKPRGKLIVHKPPTERVLCVCGHPVRSRHIEVWDSYVAPDGLPPDEDSHNDEAAEQFERGLHCSHCNDFIRDEAGEPNGYEDIPELLANGKLKLMDSVSPDRQAGPA